MFILAVGVLSVGLSRRWQLPAAKRAAGRSSDWIAWLGWVYGHKRMMGRPLLGVAHLCLVWGFSLFILIVVLAQTPLVFPRVAAQAVSFLLDITGLLMILSVLYLFFRRIGRMLQKRDVRGPKRTLFPLILLLVILFSGFMAEGARLSLLPPHQSIASPVGAVFSNMVPAAPRFMQMMIWVHFLFVIIFLAAIPFTFMRHLASTSVYLLFRGKENPQRPSNLDLDKDMLGASTVMDLSEIQLREAEACVSCGRCDEHCPALISGKPLSPRTVMGKIVDQMEAFPKFRESFSMEQMPRLSDTISTDEIWACTTCMACIAQCPAYIRPMDKIIELRRNQVLQQGALPEEAIAMVRNLELYGDINGRGIARRADWAFNRQVSRVTSSTFPPEVLLWVGCSGAFHPEYQETTRDFVRLLKAANMNFGILAQQELCCGDPVRKLGDEDLFLKLARHNIDQFRHYKIQKIVTLCPHCFNTLGREYQELGCDVEVIPAVVMVEQLIQDGRLTMKYPFAGSIAIHDPCYLGRYNGIYEPLRRVCRSIPGATLKELDRNRENGFCCGGGGGRMWLHEMLGEKISLVRAREAVAANVEAIATACPYCLTMMKDGVNATDVENPPRVLDIIQLAAESLAESKTSGRKRVIS